MNLRAALLPAVGCVALVATVAAADPPPGREQGGAAEAPAVPGKNGGESWKPPRTPWGDPDLQGTWSYASLTPLERPTAIRDKEFFSPEEAEARNRSSVTERPHVPGNVGSYNIHWFDRGTVAPNRRTSLIVDPPNGRLPSLTAAGQSRVDERRARFRGRPDSWLNFTAWTRCITYHGVPPISTGYNNTYLILQTPDHVAILVENIHDVRIIPLDGRPGLDARIRQWNGDSRGYWDGDTLVVETGNFSDQTQHRYPSSMDLRSVERFTRIGPDTIQNEFAISDPATYTQPWKALRLMPRLDGYVIYEYACHEGNYSMAIALSGAREEDRVEAESGSSRD